MARSSSSTSIDGSAAAAGAMPRTVAQPMPTLPWRGWPARNATAGSTSSGASRCSNVASDTIFADRARVAATASEVATTSASSTPTKLWAMAPIDFQVTVDSNDPHAQARFWAEALGFYVEDNHDFVQQMLDAGVATDDDVVTIDGRLFWRTGAAIRHPSGAPRLLFMQVPETKTVKNRWHLDLNVGRENLDAEVARLTTLGARELYKVDEPGAFHTTMADPEGNEFCVQ